MKPISLTRAEEIVELPSVKEMPTVKVALCVACGKYHGSSRIGWLCLEREVATLRKRNAALKGEKRKLSAEVAELRTALAEPRAALPSSMVREFHAAMGQATLDVPQVPSEDVVRLRLRLIFEECVETISSVFHGVAKSREVNWLFDVIRDRYVKVSLPDFADGLADLVYVIFGSALAFGIDLDRVLAEVHRANMAKAGGPKRGDGKILKPEGWTPTNIRNALLDQGWKGE
jgi:predicted HAD superfamily Cof-like phosphohydrolase